MYYTRFTKAIIHHFLIQEKSLSLRNKIGMHTSKDDYLINSLRFVSAKESTLIYGAILFECLTSPAMKESKVYKTYLGYATGDVPPKMDQKIKKASPSKIDNDLVPVDEDVPKGKELRDLPRSLQLSQQQVSSSERLLWKQSLKGRAEVSDLEQETNSKDDGSRRGGCAITDAVIWTSKSGLMRLKELVKVRVMMLIMIALNKDEIERTPTKLLKMTLAASNSLYKSLTDSCDELMSTPIDFFGYILNGLKIKNLTQEILLGPAFKLLKGTCSNFAELEYDFEECYRALSEKLD
ncbi:hypothetical protein Tco_0359401 [Tanacetum coccineum]